LTAGSLTGRFGRRIAKVSREMVKKGYIHLLASDAHSTQGRPPILSHAVAKLAKLVGRERAQAMVTQVPEKIINGEPVL
jgi:protein-tyrosine phosphatase